jgi:hypothetical protein
MSKHNNVNPDYYKVAGGETPGNAVAKAPKALDDDEAARARWMKRQQRKDNGDRQSGDRRSAEPSTEKEPSTE